MRHKPRCSGTYAAATSQAIDAAEDRLEVLARLFDRTGATIAPVTTYNGDTNDDNDD